METRRRGWMGAVLLGLLLALAAAPATSQVSDATIEVTVTDEQGQVLPGVSVTVRRPDTGFERVVVTNDAGEARIPALVPGLYQVRFTLQGFAQVSQEGLTLRIGQTARLDVRMKIASVQETVTVEAEATPLVDVYKTDS